jgi:hypothetical protein
MILIGLFCLGFVLGAHFRDTKHERVIAEHNRRRDLALESFRSSWHDAYDDRDRMWRDLLCRYRLATWQRGRFTLLIPDTDYPMVPIQEVVP